MAAAGLYKLDVGDSYPANCFPIRPLFHQRKNGMNSPLSNSNSIHCSLQFYHFTDRPIEWHLINLSKTVWNKIIQHGACFLLIRQGLVTGWLLTEMQWNINTKIHELRNQRETVLPQTQLCLSAHGLKSVRHQIFLATHWMLLSW